MKVCVDERVNESVHRTEVEKEDGTTPYTIPDVKVATSTPCGTTTDLLVASRDCFHADRHLFVNVNVASHHACL